MGPRPWVDGSAKTEEPWRETGGEGWAPDYMGGNIQILPQTLNPPQTGGPNLHAHPHPAVALRANPQPSRVCLLAAPLHVLSLTPLSEDCHSQSYNSHVKAQVDPLFQADLRQSFIPLKAFTKSPCLISDTFCLLGWSLSSSLSVSGSSPSGAGVLSPMIFSRTLCLWKVSQGQF